MPKEYPGLTTKEILMLKGMTSEEADNFIAGIKEGLADRAAGRVHPWSEVKKELGL